MNKVVAVLLGSILVLSSLGWAKENTYTTYNDSNKWVHIDLHFTDPNQVIGHDCPNHSAWIAPGASDTRKKDERCLATKLDWGVADTRSSHITPQKTLRLSPNDNCSQCKINFTIRCADPECASYEAYS